MLSDEDKKWIDERLRNFLSGVVTVHEGFAKQVEVRLDSLSARLDALYARIERAETTILQEIHSVRAQLITQEPERDYEEAFDELFGCNKELYGADFDTLLKEMRGE